MSTHKGSFLERVIRAITRGTIPIDGSQCDGPCVVQRAGRCNESAARRQDRAAISDTLAEPALSAAAFAHFVQNGIRPIADLIPFTTSCSNSRCPGNSSLR